jgi:hypothetical protein
MRRWVIACLALAVGAVAAEACPDPKRDSRPAWAEAHPLLGRAFVGGRDIGPVVAVNGSCEVGYGVLRESAREFVQRGVLILGEIHDNDEHHWWRGALLGDLRPASVDRSQRPVAVFEHLKVDGPGRAALGAPDLTAEGFFDVTRWSESGWPDAGVFEPLVRPLIGRYELRPGDPPAGRVAAIARQGLSALPEPERKTMINRFALEQPLPDALNAALLDELEASHCGLVPRTAFSDMALAQRYRDAHLAHVMTAAISEGRGAVLLTGNGHVRTDRGVPLYLRAVAPDLHLLTVMLIEVVEGQTDPKAYVKPTPDGKLPADVLIFTPRAEREDACIAMRAAMQGTKQ